jgi:Replication initiator protein, pSAM2
MPPLAAVDPTPVERETLARTTCPDFDGWLRHVQSARGCARPVRLRGSVITLDARTGEVVSELDTATRPDGVLYKPCGTRRASLCPACAETYRADTYHLLHTGLAGGKGVPETVAAHPCVFVTLTAPSFGPVHTQRQAGKHKPLPCRPRRRFTPCPHGVDLSCGRVHPDGDTRLGKPLCSDCFDYAATVVWNAHAPELWRRTVIAARRHLGRSALAHTVKVKVSYAKVAEFQARGLVHFHALIRLDGLDPERPDELVPPPAGMTAGGLEDAIRHAAAATAFATVPHPANPDGWEIHWGTQVDVRVVRESVSAEITDQSVVGYLVKYATKSTEAVGGVPHRITAETVELQADAHTHLGRLIAACWTYGNVPAGREYESFRALRRWAHMLGFRGHFSTKSRRYSTTLRQIRGERAVYQRRRVLIRTRHLDVDPDSTLTIGMLSYVGIGWHTTGDAMLAMCVAARARERRRTAREARFSTAA